MAGNLLTQDDSPGTVELQKNCTTYGGTLPEQCTEDYIGLTQDEAQARADENGYLVKTVMIDGVNQPLLDFAGSIIHFRIEDGVVVDAFFESRGY